MFNNKKSCCEIKKTTIINVSAELKKNDSAITKVMWVFLIAINSLLLNMKSYM